MNHKKDCAVLEYVHPKDRHSPACPCPVCLGICTCGAEKEAKKSKTFTVIITGADANEVTESKLQGIVNRGLPALSSAKVLQNNKTQICDGCQKERRDVKACGKDANGDPDSPDLCFLCRKENERHRVYSQSSGRYIPVDSMEFIFDS